MNRLKNMSPIYSETTLKEIRELPEFKDFGAYMFWRGKTCGTDESEYTLRQYAFDSRGGEVSAHLFGLRNLQKLISKGIKVAYDIWSPEEIAAEPDRNQAKLFYLPCGDSSKPFIMFIAGGAYEDVYSLGQSFPCAARANELGYNAFILTYRCITPETSGIMPKPIDDLVKALKLIFDSPDLFYVNVENYALCGFSAGGHLAAEMGTDNFGYENYGLPAPSTLMLCYPLTEVSPDVGERVLNSMVGSNRSEEYIYSYNVQMNMSEKFPPTFLYQCKNDTLLPYEQSVNMVKKLTELGIDHVFKAVERGYHGYGLADGSMSEGWLEEAIDFWKAHFC